MKYRSRKFDVECKVCTKVVTGSKCISCTNCDHFIHSRCAGLTNKDIELIESTSLSWTCTSCCSNIFPFFSHSLTKTQTTVKKQKNTKSCFVCMKTLKNNYKPKLISENNPIYLCLNCKVEDVQIDNLEHLECTNCNSIVQYQSIFCNLCSHWVHAKCVPISLSDLNKTIVDDWFCPSCLANIFPFYNIALHNVPANSLPLVDNSEYKTYNDCSICTKTVTSDKSLNCSNCNHWVHKRCIGSFKTVSNEFDAHLNYYDTTDWFCFNCIRDIFPYADTDCGELELMAFESKYSITVTGNDLREICSNLIAVDLFNNKMIRPNHDTFKTEEDIDVQSIAPPTDNCNYVFDFKQTNSKCYLSLINFNIRSIRANFDSFNNTILFNNNIKPTFIILTETWTDKETNIDDFHIVGYHQPLLQSRKRNKGGGIMLYIDDSLTSYRLRHDLSFVDESNNCLSVEAKLDNKVYIITGIYRSPSNYNNTFLPKLEAVIDKIRSSGYKSIITGDFNYNLINYEHHNDTETLFNIMTSSGYQTMVTKPTRITKNTATLIDHIWTNYNIEQTNCKTNILVTDVTDHLPTLYIDEGVKPIAGFTYITYHQINDRNTTSFLENLHSKDSEFAEIANDLSNSADEKYENFFRRFIDMYNTHFPVRTKKVHNKTLAKPWITPPIQCLIKKKNKLYDKKLRTSNEKDIERYKQVNKEKEEAINKSKADYYKDKLYNESTTTKQRWDTIRELINRQKSTSKQCPLSTNQLGQYYSTVAEKLCQKMKNIPTNELPPEIKNKKLLLDEATPKFNFEPLEEEEVYTYLNDLDVTKGPGIDQIATRIVKECGSLIASHLTTLFNNHITEGTYPSMLKTARCVPVYKGQNADPYQPASYRPISILTSINKVFEKCIHSQISTFLEENQHLPNFQYGYRKGHNTQQAIAKLCTNIENNRNNKLTTISVFMDLSKAFDTVNKDILIEKLIDLKFNDKSVSLIANYMTDRHLCFKNKKTELFTLKHGVPQGSVLGPLLFLLYIYDMKFLCQDITSIVYADDTTLIITGKTMKEATEKCNTVLDKFYTYFTYNKLTINESKTKYMVFSSSKRITKHDKKQANVIMNNVILEEVQNIKFLGVIINNKLNWNDHKLYVKTKGSKSIGILYNCRKILKHKDVLAMYRTFVEPFYMYCLPIWGSTVTSSTDIITKLQNKILRILFECRRTDDAWDAAKGKILSIQQLCAHETAKLCFKHHTQKLPINFSQCIMPTKFNMEEQHYTLRNHIDKQYSYKTDCSKFTLSFPHHCIKTWNNLPTKLKEMAYNNTSYQLFNSQSKRHFLSTEF